jgi:isoleucyl-tRNA synthetase
VKEDSGTGVVHQAPAFGDDDFRVCVSHGIVQKDGEIPCPIDPNGHFTEQVTHFAGKYIKVIRFEILIFEFNC